MVVYLPPEFNQGLTYLKKKIFTVYVEYFRQLRQLLKYFLGGGKQKCKRFPNFLAIWPYFYNPNFSHLCASVSPNTLLIIIYPAIISLKTQTRYAQLCLQIPWDGVSNDGLRRGSSPGSWPPWGVPPSPRRCPGSLATCTWPWCGVGPGSCGRNRRCWCRPGSEPGGEGDMHVYSLNIYWIISKAIQKNPLKSHPLHQD